MGAMIMFVSLVTLLVAVLAILIVVLVKLSKKDDVSPLDDALQRSDRALREGLQNSSDQMQGILFERFGTIQESNQKNLERVNRTLEENIQRLQESSQKNLERVSTTLEEKTRLLQESNEKKLDEMRRTVDERLQKTLETRLTESFKTVSEHLNNVQQGLGEMKTLASDVGGLKKALLNVKNRGMFGEVQLERILEDMLSPAQYEKNVATKAGSQERVEFAIRLPGQSDEDLVYLPIDSKFPIEDYERLLEGNENGDKDMIEAARKALAQRVRSFAKDIHTKYIDPPGTTEFAILFLPTEGLYAEIVQNVALFESLQRDFRITVTGPTTLAAFLNALQMGFKTLAIEKRSVEVWKVLGAVKTEFNKFAEALEKTQEKIRSADKDLDTLVGTRTNVMKRQLRQVEELPEAEAARIIGE
ncbi:MAG: DNA recombination protein RmuC [Clostridiales Family XIII bacterium]|jgi:DNA recombination protein RmuC|nr:DNA recombination protein RmuC [Clostridiales Family XIII bacterium]